MTRDPKGGSQSQSVTALTVSLSKTHPFPQPLVDQVLGVSRFQRGSGKFRFSGHSLHHYVLQCTARGRCWHSISGYGIEMAPGLALWLDELEPHRVEVTQPPWMFYSIFFASQIPLPSLPQRVRKLSASSVREFAALWKLWNGRRDLPHLREAQVRWKLEKLLQEFLGSPVVKLSDPSPSTRLWWRVDAQIRHHLDLPYDLPMLEQIAHSSRTAIARSCREAVGTSPMKAVKSIRMHAAFSLVHKSDLRIGEIASRLGYARIHEFSRDYRKFHKLSPRKDRRSR